jgi:hypothetical protein
MFSFSTELRGAIAPVGTRPPQRMQAVLLISTGSLSSHRFASSIDGFLAWCFNSKLLGAQRLLQGCKILLEGFDSRAPNSAK